MTMDNIPQRLVAEAIGAFALCFMGIGSIILTQGQDVVAIALAHGLAIGLCVAALGHISGGHFNPAVTAGMFAARKIPGPESVAYVIAQLVGAVLGAGALTLIYLDVDRNRVNLGLPSVGTSITADPAVSLSNMNAVIMEAILTFFLVLVIFGVAVDPRTGGRAIAGLAIGLTITMGVLAGFAVSGAAMNPSRWFGPAIVQQDFTDFWIWIVGPIIGGVAAGLLFAEFLMDKIDTVAVGSEDVTGQDIQERAPNPPPARPPSKRRRRKSR